MAIEEGFPGQRLLVMPRPRVRAALAGPGASHLVVTDAGYFPEARAHARARVEGIAECIILVCTRGAGWCEVGGVRHPVQAGQVVLLPPGTPHSYGADTAAPWTLWWLHVVGRDLAEFLRVAGVIAAAPVRDLSDTFRIVALVEEVVQAMERDLTFASTLAASGAAWHLMALLCSERTAGAPRVSAIDQAIEYLRQHVTDQVSIGDLAQTARLSPSHFAARFRQETGTSPLKYQTQLRMARARALLDTTDLPVAQIAARVGYADPFYFARQFTAVHGVPPIRYRREGKG
ncbi:helix-turn-helix domain-containing protein [Rathayibacter sp. VKM Ac-2803]|uniref:helix-turn-helix domain-containing protein n=1 Tax=Rathayibacter sp. VKM Ac-2803 TaxID=2609256 RepID=UPI00135904C6|nr:AraC family transcriptional regulator [Rathayibacter sp. VKM Ac-2803]MWV51310.1 helix-turn-helix domain-containing protein [Rathayibacter sp. VKM Ac-2803]